MSLPVCNSEYLESSEVVLSTCIPEKHQDEPIFLQNPVQYSPISECALTRTLLLVRGCDKACSLKGEDALSGAVSVPT